jgi:hypothetical protein
MTPEERARNIHEMTVYFGQLAAARRAHGADDLLTALVEAEVDGQSLQDWEVLGFCLLLLLAGNETTTNLLGNMLNVLVDRPAWWQQLRADRRLIDTVIEETLRYESPTQYLFRETTREVEISGITSPRGVEVLVSFVWTLRDVAWLLNLQKILQPSPPT